MDYVGERFIAGDVFLRELILAAKTEDAIIQMIEPGLLKKENSKGMNFGKILLAAVKGDTHDIGKNIVGLVMKSRDLR